MSVPADQRKEGKLEVATKCRELCVYTVKITSNKNVFTPETDSVIVDKIKNLAIDIYLDVWKANNIRVDDNPNKWLRRNHLQIEAAEKCNDLLALIFVSQTVYHLRAKRIEFWSELVIESRNLIRKWNHGDSNRYSYLLKNKQ